MKFEFCRFSGRLLAAGVLWLAVTCSAHAVDEMDDATTFVLIGASYAASWQTESLAGQPLINKGIGGNESGEMLDRFADDVVALQPRAVVIWGFINDIFRSSPSELEATKLRIRENIAAMVQLARSSGIEVIVATEVTVREPAGFTNWLAGLVGRAMGKTSYRQYINEHVMDVNQWLRDFAEKEQLLVLDFERALADDDHRRKAKYTQDDGSHLTAAAYSEITKYAESRLAPTFVNSLNH